MRGIWVRLVRWRGNWLMSVGDDWLPDRNVCLARWEFVLVFLRKRLIGYLLHFKFFE